MTTHLSARIVWHEGAWNGRICEHPSENSYCVVQQHIRETLSDPKKLKREEDAAGQPFKPGTVTSQAVGKKLQTLLDQAVLCSEGAVLVLKRSKLDRANCNRYRVAASEA